MKSKLKFQYGKRSSTRMEVAGERIKNGETGIAVSNFVSKLFTTVNT